MPCEPVTLQISGVHVVEAARHGPLPPWPSRVPNPVVEWCFVDGAVTTDFVFSGGARLQYWTHGRRTYDSHRDDAFEIDELARAAEADEIAAFTWMDEVHHRIVEHAHELLSVVVDGDVRARLAAAVTGAHSS